MGNIAIQAEMLGKEYRIGKRQERYKTLRDTVADVVAAPFRRAGRLLGGRAAGAAELDQRIWALRDVSFEIRQGEAVGIVGRNGAGKSTLLKILSRVTEPTRGLAEIRGRVGSLLEVGTGFHPELTGRENIYLNGAILGMKRAEIDRKFDEIVAFAEVDLFIDTPLKHYSSGMYLRLAFAVAAHLEPEILIVDEVLAVGDARFQKKCLAKMSDVGKEGRTVLFVSHNMQAITRLCERAMLFDEGRITQSGPAHEIVSLYLNSGQRTTAEKHWPDVLRAPGDEIVRLIGVRVLTEKEGVTDVVDIRRPVGIEIEYDVLESGHILLPYYHFFNDEETLVFEVLDQDPEWRGRSRQKGRYRSTAWIPGNFLSEGTLSVYSGVITPSPERWHFNEPAVSFKVLDTFEGDSARGDYTGRMTSAVRPMLRWNTQFGLNGDELSDSVGGKQK